MHHIFRFLSGCCDPMVRCKEEPFDNEPEPTVACVNFDLLNVEKAPRKILTPPQTSLLQRQIKVEPSSLLACRVERPPGQGPQRQPETSGVKRPSSTNLDQLMKSKSISQVAKRQVQVRQPFEGQESIIIWKLSSRPRSTLNQNTRNPARNFYLRPIRDNVRQTGNPRSLGTWILRTRNHSILFQVDPIQPEW